MRRPRLVPLVKIAMLIVRADDGGGLSGAAGALDRGLGARSARAQPRRHSAHEDPLFGLGQPLADGLKFIFKEEYTPAHVDKFLYIARADLDPGRGAGHLCRDSLWQRAAAVEHARHASSRSI